MHDRPKRERESRRKEKKLTSKREMYVYMSVCGRERERRGKKFYRRREGKIIHLYYYRS